jgi:hypothetical protein
MSRVRSLRFCFSTNLTAKPLGQKSDDAADAGSDGERHSNRRLHFSGYCRAGVDMSMMKQL